MAETETAVLHAEKEEVKTWIGDKKNNNLPPQTGIQEVVRYVTYWAGKDFLPELIQVDSHAPESWGWDTKSGHEFSEESISWLEIPPDIATEKEAPRLIKAKGEEQQPKLGCTGILFLPFRKLFTIL